MIKCKLLKFKQNETTDFIKDLIKIKLTVLISLLIIMVYTGYWTFSHPEKEEPNQTASPKE